MKTVSTYWWRGRPNFGDALAPLLLKRFARLEAEWAAPGDARLFTIGSVLESASDAVVVGSGKLYEQTRPSLSNTYLSVRGPLTGGSKVYGDPGLLAEELVVIAKRTHNLGLLPHWSDTELATRKEFLKYSPLVIDPAADPLEVIRQIGSCRKLVTSSLHGAIVADSFGIPRRIEVAPRMGAGHEGGMFKFRDYNHSVGIPTQIGVTQMANRHNVETLKHVLFDIYDSLEDHL